MARYYRILDLEPGASPREIRQAYKDLVLVWHPDRFSNHPRLQQKAEEKLKAINEAYEQLRDYQSPFDSAASYSSPAASPSPVASPPPPPEQPGAAPEDEVATTRVPLQTGIGLRGWSCLMIAFLGYLFLGLVLSGPKISGMLASGVWVLALGISWPRYVYEPIERLVAIVILGWMSFPLLVLLLALIKWQSLPFLIGFILLAGILVSGGLAPILIYELRHELPKYRSRLESFLVLSGIAWLGLGLGFGLGPLLLQTGF